MQPLEALTNFHPLAEMAAVGTGAVGFGPEGRPEPPAEQCAEILLEAVPHVMRSVHDVIHEISDPEITVAQFRALMFIHKHRGANLSAAAEFLGLRLASASKLVDLLVKRRLLGRANDPSDRRRMVLRLTSRGEALLQEADDLARRRLAGILGRLAGEELRVLREGLDLLQHSFMPTTERKGGSAATKTFLRTQTRQA